MHLTSDSIPKLEFAAFQSFPEIFHGTILIPKEGTCKDLACQMLAKQGLMPCFAKQIHSDKVAIARPGIAPDPCDALMTEEIGLALCVFHADCQSILLFDPCRKAIAAAHSGWRGSVSNIIAKTVEAMAKSYGTRASDLLACVAPSLGPCHAEFIHYRQELPQNFWAFGDERSHFDFWRISQKQLIDAGIRKENIEIAEICSFDNPAWFFSYRRDKTAERNITYIAMKNRGL